MMARALLVHLLDASLRAVLLAALAAVVLLALNGRRAAAVGHSLWTIVLAGMLTLLGVGPLLPALPLRIFPPPQSGHALLTAAKPAAGDEIALFLYLSISVASCVRLLAGSLLARRLLAA